MEVTEEVMVEAATDLLIEDNIYFCFTIDGKYEIFFSAEVRRI